MKQRTLPLLALLLIVPALQAAEKSHLRGGRYCEILLAKSLTTFAVYNTWGLNDCPESLWRKETVALVKKETNATAAHLNGPRYWVIDGFTRSNLVNPTVKSIGGIPMREAGVLHLSVFDLLKAKSFYQEHKVARQTTWIYQAGKPVYELIDPKGNVFVMQSYSTEFAKQTQATLSDLASKLTLPSGWRFKTGTLQQTQRLQAIHNIAIVVQDNLSNTYQMATHDFLQ